MIDVSDLIGIPYKEHGRGVDGYDCYGLVMEVERRIGVELPDYDYEVHSDSLTNEKVEEAIDSGRAVKIPTFADGAMVLVSNGRGQKSHIGVYVGDGMICHCDKHGVHLEPEGAFRARLQGIYIWRK